MSLYVQSPGWQSTTTAISAFWGHPPATLEDQMALELAVAHKHMLRAQRLAERIAKGKP